AVACLCDPCDGPAYHAGAWPDVSSCHMAHAVRTSTGDGDLAAIGLYRTRRSLAACPLDGALSGASDRGRRTGRRWHPGFIDLYRLSLSGGGGAMKANLYLTNIFLALAWALVTGSFSFANIVFGFLLGAVALYLIREQVDSLGYFERGRKLVSLALLFI